jgi:dihydroorotase
MEQRYTNFLVKGGRLIDPVSGRDGALDIHVIDGKIEAVGSDIAAEGASVVDAKDCVVTPGLIDVHLHLMKGLGAFGVDPDIFGVGSGVTTVVDAGSAGHTLLNVFRNYVTDNAKTRVLNYINLSTLGGVSGPGYSILADPRLIDEAKIEQAVEANRDIIVGIKIMATGGALGTQGLKPLERARKLGDALKIPLLIHIGESWTKGAEPVAIGDVLKYLVPGDIITHMFTVHPGGLLDANGKLWPQVRDAKATGVLMDVGHGLHNLNFDVARKVLDQGLHPDGVSTDGHRGNRAGPVYDLPTTMAKLMALGFSLKQVIEMATTNAAKLLGRRNQLGTLRVGDKAEISVLKIEDREWQALDSQKGTIPAKQTITPVYAIRGDMIYEPLPVERP